MMIRETEWKVPNRYQILNLIGYGSFGVVKLAFDQETQREVSIKKIENIFKDKRKAHETYREIKVLKHVSHDNLIYLMHGFLYEPMDEVYLVTPFMELTLYERLYKKKPELDDDFKILYMYQILLGLSYLHERNIIHRDLKPTNITVTNRELKIIDFGLAREEKDDMTEDVCTRWYRAPEIIIDHRHYNRAADMFSAGCVLAELLVKRVIFESKHYMHHLKLVYEALGEPTEEYLRNKEKSVVKVVNFIVKDENFCACLRFEDNFPEIDSTSEKGQIEIDFLKRMLTVDPNDRIDCDEALKHVYLKKYFDDEEEERDATKQPIELFQNPEDEDKYSIEEWKEMILRELNNA